MSVPAPASPFVKHPGEPASGPQLDYLAKLLDSREPGIWHERYNLVSKLGITKGAASDLITGLKAAPLKKTADPASLAFGYYLDQAETLWSWQEQKASKYSNTLVPKLAKLTLYKKSKWVIDPETGVGSWVEQPKGKWSVFSSYSSAKMAPVKLAGLAPLTPAQLAEQSKLYGVCVRCGRTLTAKESVAKSVGPVCAKYLGL